MEHMMSSGRIDTVTWALNTIYVIELKLQNNGGQEAAKQQITANNIETFKDDVHEVIPLIIELDNDGKGLLRYTNDLTA